MFVSDNAARILGVTTPPEESPALLKEKGKRLEERIEELDLPIRRAARGANMSPGTVYKIFAGKASEKKVTDLERFVDDYASNPEDRPEDPLDFQSTTEGLIEIELEDVSGTDWRVGRIVARGTPGAHDDLVDSVARILDHLREKESDPGI